MKPLTPKTIELLNFAVGFTKSHFMSLPKNVLVDQLIKDFHDAEADLFNATYKEEN